MPPSPNSVVMPPNGELAVDLVHATENVADHLTHFYLFFMPDFARDVYRDEAWHLAAHERFVALKGTASQDILPARAQFRVGALSVIATRVARQGIRLLDSASSSTR